MYHYTHSFSIILLSVSFYIHLSVSAICTKYTSTNSTNSSSIPYAFSCENLLCVTHISERIFTSICWTEWKMKWKRVTTALLTELFFILDDNVRLSWFISHRKSIWEDSKVLLLSYKIFIVQWCSSFELQMRRVCVCVHLQSWLAVLCNLYQSWEWVPLNQFLIVRFSRNWSYLDTLSPVPVNNNLRLSSFWLHLLCRALSSHSYTSFREEMQRCYIYLLLRLGMFLCTCMQS